MKNSICKNNANFKVLLEAINNKPAGTAFIEDNEGKLCGIITDGDFRRLLLKGKTLSDNLEDTDYGSFVYAKQGESIENLIKKTNKIIKIIPIVNENGNLVDYFEYGHKTKFTPIAEPTLENKEFEYLLDAYTSTWISSRGKYIDQFESGFSNFIGSKHGIATSNGTVAIHLALKALDIGAGDEVIVPDITFAATINAVLLANAKPVIVDIEKESWTICPKEIEKAITPKTKAIIPVHIYGQPCDMNQIMSIAKKHKLKVIEDCAEAHGAEYKGQRVGSFGDISTFSFFANKIITTGEGGMCLTNSSELNERMRILRDHGMSKTQKYWHEEVGFNYRMTNLQAAIGCAQLEKIDVLLNRNQNIELEYQAKLDSLNLFEWQKVLPERKKVVWLVCALSNYRDEVMDALSKHNIDVRPFFYPLSDMPIYAEYAFSSTNAKELSKKGLNLPTVINIDFDHIYNALSTIKIK